MTPKTVEEINEKIDLVSPKITLREAQLAERERERVNSVNELKRVHKLKCRLRHICTLLPELERKFIGDLRDVLTRELALERELKLECIGEPKREHELAAEFRSVLKREIACEADPKRKRKLTRDFRRICMEESHVKEKFVASAIVLIVVALISTIPFLLY